MKNMIEMRVKTPDFDTLPMGEVCAWLKQNGLRIGSCSLRADGMWVVYTCDLKTEKLHNHGAGWTFADAITESVTGIATFRVDDPRNPKKNKDLGNYKHGIAGQVMPDVKTVLPSEAAAAKPKKAFLADLDDI